MKFILSLCILAVAPLVNAADYRRTVVAIEKPTEYGEQMFMRGGRNGGNSIPIKHTLSPKDKTSFFAQTSSRDVRLSWGRYDPWQGVYRKNGITRHAEGTPMIWTTNDTEYGKTLENDGEGYWRLNTGGSHYWVVDFQMDCSKVFNGGWFAFKGYLINLYGKWTGWEPSSLSQYSCDVNGTQVNIPNAKSYNHYGICGNFNIVRWGTNFCMSKSVSEVEENADFMDL